jgi:hypothetical protein
VFFLIQLWLGLQDINLAPSRTSSPGKAEPWLESCKSWKTKKIKSYGLIFLGLAGPAGYKQCAVVASQPGIGEPGSNPSGMNQRNKKDPSGHFIS